MPRSRTYFLLACLALIWGLHWPLTKIALRDWPSFTYGAMRIAAGLATVLAVQAARGQLKRPDRRDWSILISVGLGQMAGLIVFMNLALPQIAAGRSSILAYTTPLWVAVIQIAAMRGVANARQLVGLLAGLLGIGLLMNPMAIDWRSSGQVVGSAELIGSALISAVTTIHIRHHKWHSTPMDLEPWQLMVALVPVAIAAIAFDTGKPIHLNPVSIGLVFYSGVLATAIAYWLSQSIARSLTPLATAMGFLAVPVVGLLSSSALLGEPLTLLDLTGFVTTIAGILIVSLAPEREAPAASTAELALEAELNG